MPRGLLAFLYGFFFGSLSQGHWFINQVLKGLAIRDSRRDFIPLLDVYCVPVKWIAAFRDMAITSFSSAAILLLAPSCTY